MISTAQPIASYVFAVRKGPSLPEQKKKNCYQACTKQNKYKNYKKMLYSKTPDQLMGLSLV